MSNVIGGEKGTTYFQVPESLVRSGDLRDLSGSSVKLYIFLCREMNRYGNVELEYTNEDICVYTGIKDHNTVKKVRQELESHGRIRARRGPSGGFIYAVLNDLGIVFSPAKGRKSVRLHIRREKPVELTATNQTASSRFSVPPYGGAGHLNAHTQPNLQEPRVMQLVHGFCFVHKRETVHWWRECEYLCQECHPNPATLPVERSHSTPESPKSRSVAKAWRQPTARELGF